MDVIEELKFLGKFTKKNRGGGRGGRGRVGGGGQDGCERRIEVFVKIQKKTRFDVYETLCPQQMLVYKGGQIKNWSGEYRDIIPTKLQCQAVQRALQSPNLQREIIRKNEITFFLIFTN